MVSLAGSAQQSVPVEPVCPKVLSEHPGLPADRPTFIPNPRGASPAGLWLVTINRAVSGLTADPFSYRNSDRNRAISGADAWVPPQGAPRLRQYGLFQSQSLALGSPPPDSGAARSV